MGIPSIEKIAATVADDIAKRQEATGVLTFDLRDRIKAALLKFWNSGNYAGKYYTKISGQREELQKIISLIQNSPEITIPVTSVDGSFSTISLQDALLDRVRELDSGGG